MEVRVHIERLVVDGPALGRRASAQLTAALSAELGRLIAERGLPGPATSGFAVPVASGGAVAAGSAADPVAYGRALAGAVYVGLEGGR